MTAYPQPVNTDSNGVKTSADYTDRGDGTVAWHETHRVYDGGNVTQGSVADAAVADHTVSGTIVGLLKGLLRLLRVADEGIAKADQTGHFAGNAGVMGLLVRKDDTTGSVAADGEYAPANVNWYGALRTSPVESRNATTTVYASNLLVKAGSGKLFGIQGYNAGGAQFLQIHNAAALPADSSVPEVVILIPATSTFSLDFASVGRTFDTGIVICNSASGPTKTLGAADCWIDAQYI